MLIIPVPISTQNFNTCLHARSKEYNLEQVRNGPVLTQTPPFQCPLAELVFCLPDHKARVSGKGLNLGDLCSL